MLVVSRHFAVRMWAVLGCLRSRIFASCVVKHFFGYCFSARKFCSLHQYSSAQMNRGIRCRETVGNLDEHDVETAMYL